MTEIIEENTEVLEGELIIAHDGQKLFRSISACSDYVSVFGIKHYVIRDGYIKDEHTQDGKYVVQLQYTKQNI